MNQLEYNRRLCHSHILSTIILATQLGLCGSSPSTPSSLRHVKQRAEGSRRARKAMGTSLGEAEFVRRIET